MSEPFDDRLCDHQTLEEIELLADVIIAATESAGPLPSEQIDTVLGVGHDHEGGESGEPGKPRG